MLPAGNDALILLYQTSMAYTAAVGHRSVISHLVVVSLIKLKINLLHICSSVFDFVSGSWPNRAVFKILAEYSVQQPLRKSMVGTAHNLVGPAPLCKVSHPSPSDVPLLMHAAVRGMLVSGAIVGKAGFRGNCGESNGVVGVVV